MYTGNHIADGDYDAHAAIVSAHYQLTQGGETGRRMYSQIGAVPRPCY